MLQLANTDRANCSSNGAGLDRRGRFWRQRGILIVVECCPGVDPLRYDAFACVVVRGIIHPLNGPELNELVDAPANSNPLFIGDCSHVRTCVASREPRA